jgi:hypothetical protein
MKQEEKLEEGMHDYSGLIDTMNNGSLSVLFAAIGIGKTGIDFSKIEDILKLKENREKALEAFDEAARSKAKDIEYSLDQLIEIEKTIDERYPVGHNPFPTTLIPFGLYLGELIVRTIPGAELVKSAPSMWDITVKFKMASQEGWFQAKPFRRVSKFWKNREDRMSSFFRMCEFMSEIEFTEEYIKSRADEDGWIYMESGDKFRMMKKGKDGLSEEELKTWPAK